MSLLLPIGGLFGRFSCNPQSSCNFPLAGSGWWFRRILFVDWL